MPQTPSQAASITLSRSPAGKFRGIKRSTKFDHLMRSSRKDQSCRDRHVFQCGKRNSAIMRESFFESFQQVTEFADCCDQIETDRHLRFRCQCQTEWNPYDRMTLTLATRFRY